MGKAFVSWVNTPQIALKGDGTPGGLFQNRLALVEGKCYAGRIVLAGTPEAGPIQVSLVWGRGASDRNTVMIEKVTSTFTTFPLQFRANSSTDCRSVISSSIHPGGLMSSGRPISLISKSKDGVGIISQVYWMITRDIL